MSEKLQQKSLQTHGVIKNDMSHNFDHNFPKNTEPIFMKPYVWVLVMTELCHLMLNILLGQVWIKFVITDCTHTGKYE